MANKQGRPRKAGRRDGKIAAYYNSGRLLRKKLRNVIRHSGFSAGEQWANANGCEHILAAFQKAENHLGQPLRWLEQAKAKERMHIALQELRVSATPEQKRMARQMLATT